MNDKKNEIAPAQTPQSLLSWLAIDWPPNFTRSRGLGSLVGACLTLAIPALFLLALIAAFAVLGKTILDVFTDGGSGPSLGVGAMITALLGVPFVIWGTVIRQKALEFQKEGHITDRISAAVEQLGAEKVVKRHIETIKGTKLIKTERLVASESLKKPIFVEETLPNIEVRIGGLLSLERIAQDSTRYDQGRDHVRVMEIICAYIRENAPASGAVDFPLPEWEPLKENPTKEEREAHEMWRKTRFGDRVYFSNARQWAQSLKPPREDIQTALNVLKRRTPDQRKVEANWPNVGPALQGWVFDEATFQRLPDGSSDIAPTKDVMAAFETQRDMWGVKMREYSGFSLDLRDTDLQRADLSDAVFSGALLNGARMEGAHLHQARMEGATLNNARLEGAELGEAQMDWIILDGAWMEAAYLNEANMGFAFLYAARMEGANLCHARMEGVRLFDARLERAHLNSARMEGAILDEASLPGAILHGTRMEGADISRARLDENTSFYSANLQGVRMRNVDLNIAGLAQDQINASFGDGSVTLPDGIEWPAHWPEDYLDLSDYELAYQNWLKTRAR